MGVFGCGGSNGGGDSSSDSGATNTTTTTTSSASTLDLNGVFNSLSSVSIQQFTLTQSGTSVNGSGFFVNNVFNSASFNITGTLSGTTSPSTLTFSISSNASSCLPLNMSGTATAEITSSNNTTIIGSLSGTGCDGLQADLTFGALKA